MRTLQQKIQRTQVLYRYRISAVVLRFLFFSTLAKLGPGLHCLLGLVFARPLQAIIRSMGRRRVQIKRIEDKARRQTTFTKRRDGLFKKTGKICTLTGGEAAVITFSDAGNAFTFGYPSVNSVIDRYLAKTAEADADVDEDENLNLSERVRGIQEKNVEAENKLEKALTAMVGGNPEPIEAFGLEQLEQLKAKVETIIHKATVTNNNSTIPHGLGFG